MLQMENGRCLYHSVVDVLAHTLQTAPYSVVLNDMLARYFSVLLIHKSFGIHVLTKLL